MKWHVWYWLVIAALGAAWLWQHDRTVRARAVAEQRADSLHLAQQVLAAAAQEMLRRQHEDSATQHRQYALIRRQADSLAVTKHAQDSLSGAIRASLPTDSQQQAFDQLRALGAQREGLLMAERDSALVLLARAGQSRDSLAGLLRQSLAQNVAYQAALHQALKRPLWDRTVPRVGMLVLAYLAGKRL